MRSMVCVLLLSCSILAQNAPDSADASGTFFIDGVAYQYAVGTHYTVVIAAHSVINHKFVAVKVRVYNRGQRSITLRPEDIAVRDASANRELAAITGTDLAQRLRKPYNMARYTVNGIAGGPTDGIITSDMVTPQFLEMMRAMAAHGNRPTMSANNVLYADTPGALEEDASMTASECDQVCRLRARETQAADPLTQLQRQVSPDTVESFALRANTIPPRGNVGGILYFPLGKLSDHGGKPHVWRVILSLADEQLAFELPVE